MGQATQTLATQEAAARARTDQTMRALSFMDKMAGGPESRTLAKQKELETFRASLDTPERRMAKEKQVLEERKQDFYETFRNRWLDIMQQKATTGEGKEVEKRKAAALKTMTAIAKEIQKAESKAAAKGKSASIAPELYDSYAMAALEAGQGNVQMTYSPEVSVYQSEWPQLSAVTNFLGFTTTPGEAISVTAYEWGLLRQVEMERPDMPYSERIARLQTARKKHGGALSGPPTRK